MRGVPKEKQDALIRRAAEMVELGQLLDRKPGALSGGQRQRAALARAVVREPQVFLMDEPLSNLDAKLRASMRVQIKHLQRQLRITTVYVTHDQIEAMTLADRIVIMDKGAIQQVGTPDEIYSDPGQHLRRRLHRLAADEPDPRRGRQRPLPRPRHRRAGARRSSRAR